jgi:hypothetical protein
MYVEHHMCHGTGLLCLEYNCLLHHVYILCILVVSAREVLLATSASQRPRMPQYLRLRLSTSQCSYGNFGAVQSLHCAIQEIIPAQGMESTMQDVRKQKNKAKAQSSVCR